MEAAPDPLLKALEHLLEGDGQRLVGIFSEGGALGPSSPHTGLLWALEMLAWDPSYLVRATQILARLARIDPGGKLANRPFRSLRGIFLTWHPATNASNALRLHALDEILKIQEDIGWRLLVAVFPKDFDHGEIEYKPRWRDAGASEREVLTHEMIRRSVNQIVTRALLHVGTDVTRWAAVIEGMHQFPPEDRSRVCQTLMEFVQTPIPQAERDTLWRILQAEVNRHKRFSSAEWALPGEEVERLEDIARTLRPADPITLNRWLFDEYHPDFPDASLRTRHDAADEPRRAAVAALFESQGIAGLLALASNVKLPHLVGVTAATVISDLNSLLQLLNTSLETDPPLESFAIALSATAATKHGVAWQEKVLRQAREHGWPANRVVTVLLRWPEPETWTIAQSLGPDVDRLYWSRKPVWPRIDGEIALATATTKYVDARRAAEAIEAIGDQLVQLPAEGVLRLIDAALEEINSGQFQSQGGFAYELEQLFAGLAQREDISDLEIARREYAFLPLLDDSRHPLVLHRLLLSEPGFYVEILKDVYRASSAAPEEPDEPRAARAQLGYRLLHSIRAVPGLRTDGSVDDTALHDWVTRAREAAAAAGRAVVGDHEIGRLLAHIPADPLDGAWPHRSLRTLLEQSAASELERGIEIEQVNKRGVYRKALYEGGKQERDLAEQARGWATTCEAWPRTALMLRRIADTWEHHARSEDTRAEQDKARHS
jgi:hypothetical protein